MAIGHSLLRRCTRLPAVAAPVVIALVATLALQALPARDAAEMVSGLAADGTGFYSGTSQISVGSYTLALSHVLTDLDLYAFVSFLRNPQTDSLVVASLQATPLAGSRDAKKIDARLLTLAGDTLATYGGCAFIAPTGRWEGACPEYLAWRPRWGYAPARGVLRRNLPKLFLHNYEGIFRFLDPMDAVRRAYVTAGRGESLWVRNEVVSLAPTETGRLPAIELPYGCEQELAVAAQTSRGDVALLRASGGYQNVDRLYRLLDQPRLTAEERVIQLRSNAIVGSFRGIIAIDPTAGLARWVRPIGVTTAPFVVADVNGDGLDEFILSSYCPENGVSYGGMTDAGTAYVICLDWYGNVLWRRPFHGQYLGARAAVADVRGDADPEVVVVVSSNKPGEPGCAAVLASDGTTIVEKRHADGFYGLVVADLDGRGKPEIVAGALDGRVVAFDGDLEIVASFQDTAHADWTGRWLMPCAAGDLDGDGEVEVVGASSGWNSGPFVPSGRKVEWDSLSYVVTLGPRLEEEARFLVPPVDGKPSPIRVMPSHPIQIASVLDADADGSNEIVLSGVGPGLMVIEVVKREAH